MSVKTRDAAYEFETTFDRAAQDYENSRPEYCRQLYCDLMVYQPIGQQSEVLEIGAGTGKATGPILKTGCRLTALEPGKSLAKIAKEKYRDDERFLLRQEKLQDFECAGESFDLIYAATAFHWIEEEYGYARVFDLLKPGGAFARFAYHAGEDESRPDLAREIRAAYSRCSGMPGKGRSFDETDAQALAMRACRFGFTDPVWRIYRMKKDFSADGYMRLLRTYPDHMGLEADERRRLTDSIYEAIKQHGGTVTVYYTIDMELIRKP